jgi:O-6-methylguanine DNA methyltransferase
METDRKWIIVRIDGKIAAISTDYRLLAEITARIAAPTKSGKKINQKNNLPYQNISAEAADFDQIWKLRQEASWDDLLLFGTEFQKKVWRKLFDLTHQEDNTVRLISYTDFAQLCQNRAGVRAVAHAIGLNPVSVVIPCHLVVPKESIDKMKEINKKAEATIFKGVDLCLNSILKNETIDFGNYALGPVLKRRLIALELTGEEL